MAFFSLSTFGCMMSDNMNFFLAFRFVQGVSGSFGIVVARAIAGDIYFGAELTKFISMLMLVNGLAPILAPVIGGQILFFTQWRGIFATLALIGLTLMFFSARLDETLPPQSRMKNISSGFKMFPQLVRDRYFFAHCLIQCTMFATFFAYIAGSPFLFQNIYKLSPQVYSFVFSGLGVCMVVAGLIPMRLAGRVADIKMLAWAVAQSLIGSVIFTLCVIFSADIKSVVLALVIIVTTIPILGATSFSLSMRNHGREAGAAAAPLVGVGGSDTALPMAAVMLIGAVASLLVFVKMIFATHRHGYKISFMK